MKSLRKCFLFAVSLIVVSILSACGGGGSDSGGGGGANAPTEVGMWAMTTVNGVAAAPGITLNLTGSDYTFVGPGCTETGTYTISDSTINSVVTTKTGTGTVCDPPGTTWTSPFTITETTLTIADRGGSPTVWTRI